MNTNERKNHLTCMSLEPSSSRSHNRLVVYHFGYLGYNSIEFRCFMQNKLIFLIQRSRKICNKYDYDQVDFQSFLISRNVRNKSTNSSLVKNISVGIEFKFILTIDTCTHTKYKHTHKWPQFF